MITVLTTDDPPSYKAKVVICDVFRSENSRFLADAKRLAVATTQTYILTILVGQKDMLPLFERAPIVDLAEHLKGKDSII